MSKFTKYLNEEKEKDTDAVQRVFKIQADDEDGEYKDMLKHIATLLKQKYPEGDIALSDVFDVLKNSDYKKLAKSKEGTKLIKDIWKNI